MRYDFIYDESAKTILIKQSKKGLWFNVLVALIGMGGAGVVMICVHTTIWELLGGIFFVIACCVTEPLAVLEYYRYRVIINVEGIDCCTIKQKKHCLWKDCKFIGEWRSGVRYARPVLSLCRQTVHRDAKGRVPQGYPWPTEDTFFLDEWGFLSDEQQQQILALCGGPRG